MLQGAKATCACQGTDRGYAKLPDRSLADAELRDLTKGEAVVDLDNVGGDRARVADEDAAISEEMVRPYDGTWDPNWTTYRIYNLIDVLNAPLREKVMQFEAQRKAKKERKRKEREAMEAATLQAPPAMAGQPAEPDKSSQSDGIAR